MSEAKVSEVELIKTFFASEICQRATKPLKNDIEVAIFITGCPPLALAKKNGTIQIFERTSQSPDMSFWMGKKGVEELVTLKTDDIGEIGIAIIKLMLSQDPESQLKSKVHIGSLQLLTHGYLGVLPLGGTTVMKFLASKGFTSIGKIKDAISQLRDTK